MHSTQQPASADQLPDTDETPGTAYEPGELYDELGPDRFQDAVDAGVDTGDAVVVPASAVEPGSEPETDGGLARTAALAYLRARNTLMRPAYMFGRSRVDDEASSEELADRAAVDWHPSLLHYAPLVAGMGVAAVHAAAGDPDLAATTAEVTAGYAGKWTVYNADAAQHAGGRSAARAELAERERDALAASDTAVRVVPDDTYDAVERDAELDTADPHEAEEAIAGGLD